MIGGKMSNVHSSYTIPPKHKPKFIPQNISTLWSKTDNLNIDMFLFIQANKSNFQVKMLPFFNQLYSKCNAKEKEFIQVFIAQTKQIDFAPYEIVNDKIVMKERFIHGGMNEDIILDNDDDKELNRQLQIDTRDFLQSSNNQQATFELMNRLVSIWGHQSRKSSLNIVNMVLLFNLLFAGIFTWTCNNVVDATLEVQKLSTVKSVRNTIQIAGYFVNPILRYIRSESTLPNGNEILTMAENYINDPEHADLLRYFRNARLGITVSVFLLLFVVMCFLTFIPLTFVTKNIDVSFMGFRASVHNNANQMDANQLAQLLQILHANSPQAANPHTNQLEYKKKDKGGSSHTKKKKKNKNKNKKKTKNKKHSKKKTPRRTKKHHTKKTRPRKKRM